MRVLEVILAAIKEAIKPEGVIKGEKFERYVLSLFNASGYWALVKRTQDYYNNKQMYEKHSLEADFIFKHKRLNKEIKIECKYRSSLNKDGMLEWCKNEQLDRYKRFDKDDNTYIVIGLGGKPNAPGKLYLIKLSDAKYVTIYPSSLKKYEIRKNCCFNMKGGRLVQLNYSVSKKMLLKEKLDSAADYYIDAGRISCSDLNVFSQLWTIVKGFMSTVSKYSSISWSKSMPVATGNRKTKLKSRRIIAVLIIFIAILTVILPATVPCDVVVTYTVPEEYPVQVQKDLKYGVSRSHVSAGLSGLNWMSYGKVYVENIDTEPGTFIVKCIFRTAQRTLTDTDRIYIFPGEIKVANCKADTKFGEGTTLGYDITPGKKTVIEMRTRFVEKSRIDTVQCKLRLYQKLLGWY